MSRLTALAFVASSLVDSHLAEDTPDPDLVVAERFAVTPAQKNVVAVHKQLKAAHDRLDVLTLQAVQFVINSNAYEALTDDLITAIDVLEALKPIHVAAHEAYEAEKAARRAKTAPDTDDDTSLETTEAEARPYLQ